MNPPIKLLIATSGFNTGYFWRVCQGTECFIVYALSNYDAAEACGFKFNSCSIEELQLVTKNDVAELAEYRANEQRQSDLHK